MRGLQGLFDGRGWQAGALGKKFDAHAFAQTQGVEHEFKRQVAARYLDLGFDGKALRGLLHVALGMAPAGLTHDAMRKSELGMGASADADVIAELPVIEVVATAVPRRGVSGHFVALQPGGLRQIGHGVLHVGGQVVVWQFGGLAGEQGVGFERELIEREMRRLVRQRLVDVGLAARHILLRQGEHQIEIEAGEVARGLGHRVVRLACIMHATQRAQAVIVETLHADGQAVDARLCERRKPISFEGARVGLQRDFGIGDEGQPGAHVGDQLVDSLGREQTGRAASDEDGDDAPPPHQGQRRIKIGAKRSQVGLLGNRPTGAPLMRIEIAIGALFETPRQMHIKTEGRQRAELQGAGPHVVRQRLRCTLRRRIDGRAGCGAAVNDWNVLLIHANPDVMLKETQGRPHPDLPHDVGEVRSLPPHLWGGLGWGLPSPEGALTTPPSSPNACAAEAAGFAELDRGD